MQSNELLGFSLSPQQSRIFALDLNRAVAPYLTHIKLIISGAVDPLKLQRALELLGARHEILRTRFVRHPEIDSFLQVIMPDVPVSLEIASSELDDGERPSYNELELDLESGRMIRVRLTNITPHSSELWLTAPSVCADARSLKKVASELVAAYEGSISELDDPVQYADVAEHFNAQLRSDSGVVGRQYWHAKRVSSRPLTIVRGRSRNEISNEFSPRCVRVTLFSTVLQAAHSHLNTDYITDELFLFACWQSLLKRLTGETDFLVGFAADGREMADLESCVGPMERYLPVKTSNALDSSFRETLAAAHEAVSEAILWQGFFEPVEGTYLPVCFSYYDAAWSLNGNGFTLRCASMSSCTDRFDCRLSCTAVPTGVAVELWYDESACSEKEANRILSQYVAFIESASASPDAPIGLLNCMDAQERERLLNGEGLGPIVEFSKSGIVSKVEHRVKVDPDAPALMYGNRRMTYSELNEQADQIAAHLRSRGAAPDACVALLFERSLEMIATLLGILKSGAAYLPLDPSYPDERLAYIIRDARPLLVLTQERLRERLSANDCRIESLEDLRTSRVHQHSHAQAIEPVLDDGLAYVIYTSGSSGRPKGVGITQRGLRNYVAWACDAYQFQPGDVTPLYSSLGFDLTVTSLWPVLVSGGCISLAPEGEGIESLIGSGAFSQPYATLKVTPAHLRVLKDAIGQAPAGIARRFVVGGDALRWEDLQYWNSQAPQIQVINEYGPTETVVGSCVFEVGQGRQSQGDVPIGKPIANTSLYVLDRWGNLALTGAPGELYIGGDGISRGYLNQPSLTAERFIPDPFSGRSGARLYRTGDLVRWNGDGDLVYLGRLDNQVKIRGYRIELGEIESVLAAHDRVKDAAVVVREDTAGARRLVAYVVLAPGAQNPGHEQFQTYLRARLPEYMIPAALVELHELPLTTNGKLDVQALPRPESRAANRANYVEPRTETEKAFARIWARTLGVQQIGIEDNFFELGGDSILSLQIVARAREAGYQLTVQQMFRHQTIAALAEHVQAAAPARQASGLPVSLESVPLTPIQQWFVERASADLSTGNQELLLNVPPEATPDAVELALHHLIAHHDALRLRFFRDADGNWRQSYAPFAADARVLERVDLSNVPEPLRQVKFEQAVARIHDGLNLGSGQVIRAGWLDLGQEQRRLLLVIHHLAVDGVSWRIVLEDLQVLGRQLQQGAPLRLPPTSASFIEWTNALSKYAESDALEKQLPYWGRLASQSVQPLRRDDESAANTVASRAEIRLQLTPEETQALLQDTSRAYRTRVQELLIAALARAMARWNGTPGLLLDLEGHGRADLEGPTRIDVSRTVGWFTALYPVLFDVDESEPEDYLKAAKELLRGVPDQGLSYGVLRYLHKAGRALLESAPQPEVLFNYMGQFDQVMSGGDWEFAQEATGPARDRDGRRAHLLEINAHVLRGCLDIGFGFSKAIHRESTIRLLGSYVLEEVRTLIAHCLAAKGSFTPSDFPLARLTQKELDYLQSEREITDLYPLSPMQEGMLYHSLQAPDSGVYVNQMCAELQGDLNLTAFRHAWDEVIQRHTVLRTSFSWQDVSQPVQIVHSRAELGWTELDWRHHTASEQERELSAYLAADRESGFDLTQPPLMRMTLIRTGEMRFEMVWTHHHLLLDGWSVPLILQEVLTLYSGLCSGETVKLQRTRPYADYIGWLQHQDLQRAEAFWRKTLSGFRNPAQLTIAPGEFAGDSARGFERKTRLLSRDITAALEAFTERHHLTLNTIVQGAWGMLLSRYSGQNDVLFGATTAGRPAELSGVDSMAGLFINTLPVRMKELPGDRVLDVLTRLQEQQIEARLFEFSPLHQIHRWSDVPSGQPLFDNVLIFENYPVDEALARVETGIHVQRVSTEEATNYPLTVMVVPGEQLSLQILYNRQMFDSAAVDRILEHWTVLLGNMASGLERPVSLLQMLSPSERQQALVDWNRTSEDYDRDACIHHLFEVQAARCPAATAVEFEGHAFSYAELNRRADALAQHLAELGVKPETVVGVCIDRSLEMLVALLGILKAGGAYMPLDPEYPSERLSYMIEDAHPSVILTEARLQSRLSATRARLLLLSDVGESTSRAHTGKRSANVKAGKVAYLMYTSGSTGKPKGVAVSHGAVVNFLHAMRSQLQIGAADALLAVTPLSFDIAGLELFLPLSVGARVRLVSRATSLDGSCLATALSADITIMQATPATWQMLIEAGWQGSPQLQILCGGEALPPELAKALKARGQSLWNLYGPTETTIWSLAAPITNIEPRISIGRPIANTEIYVLNDWTEPVPVGVAGELYIGGEGLARSYWNRPDLTAERFLPDPFAANGQRLYRTGDLARYRDDGTLEFLERKDHQVKIRGHRIELEEIETVLKAYPGVKQAAAAVREQSAGDKRLVAYIVPLPEAQAVDHAQLKLHLRSYLPEYMVPGSVMELDKLPLTPNGKLDRKALPKPEATDVVAASLPRGDVEMQLALIWEDLLGISQVARDQNFFELGGHSLLAISLLKRVKDQFGQDIPLSALLQDATIEHLGAILNKEYRRSHLVPIQRQGSKKPLFFVHALGASPWLYLDLARLLRRDERPFFGLQAMDDEEFGLPAPISIEERAARYIAALREVQPEGPYLLGGWSFGGYVAYEMAQQLQRRNEEVAGLFLVDIPAAIRRETPPSIDDADYLLSFAKTNAARFAETNSALERAVADLQIQQLADAGSEARLQYVMQQMIRFQILGPDVELDQVRHFVQATRRREQSMRDYHLRSYEGSLTLIRAQDNVLVTREWHVDANDPTLGWATLCAEPVDVHWVSGNHSTVLHPPHVEALAEVLQRCLRQAKPLVQLAV